MAKKKMSYSEKIALLSEYVPLHAYKKGRRVINDGEVYSAKKDIEEGTPWNPKDWKKTNYEEYTGIGEDGYLWFGEIKVVPSSWYEWHPKGKEQEELFKTYPYRAFLKCKGVTADMIPYVIFYPSEALSGKYANIAESVNKGVYIYCKDKPEDKIIVHTVKCLKLS